MSRIASLDLRHPDVIARQAANAALDRQWQWPVFPAATEAFIETGVWAPRVRAPYNQAHAIVLAGDATKLLADFNRVMRQARAAA